MLDNELVLSDNQAVTATAVSADSYDAGEQAINLGAGETIEYAVHVTDAAFAGLTSIQFQVIGADDAALTTNPVVIEESAAVLLADLTLGARPFRGKLNPSVKKRFYGFKYVVAGTGTAGKLTSFMGQGIPDNEDYYNKNYSVHIN